MTTPKPDPNNAAPDDRETQAAGWVLRCDRQLSAAEQDELSDWLARDPRNGQAFARHRRNWQRLDHLAEWRPEHSDQPNPDLLAPRFGARRGRFFRPTLLALASAAIVILAALMFFPRARQNDTPLVAGVIQRTLDDGSVVELNRGAVITVAFTPEERRVQLVQGEAHFRVTKNPARPFIVSAAGLTVRAVGTAFDVSMRASTLEVLVTEGRVQVNHSTDDEARFHAGGSTAPPVILVPQLDAGQRVVVSLTSRNEPLQVTTLTAGEVDQLLSWQHRLLDFTATPLGEVVSEFNRRNAVQLVLTDPSLVELRVSATLRSDNVEGFVNLLKAGFGVQVERYGQSEIRLTRP